jgi:Protein of unknown function (DUF4242)
MPRYVVERTFPNGLDIPAGPEGAKLCLGVIERNADECVTWVHSYVSEDRKKTFCVYDAQSPEAIRKTASKNGLPVERITQEEPSMRKCDRAHEGRQELIRIRPIRLLVAAVQAARASERRNLPLKLPLALATVAAGVVAALPAPASATSALAPEALTRARVIRAEINARYRLLAGRKLVVTEATSTGVVESLTLVTDWLEPPRVVPADNGIYFAICSARATCPYPGRSAAWPAVAFLPRRQALELALRTFLETSVSLVVVALPTAEPVWVVFERDDLLANIDAPALLGELATQPALADTELLDLIDRLTRPHLFVPLPILPPPRDTMYAVRLFGP